jgi:beta-phosphoglucomutase-like phosphatase (HAD superfamily)
MYKYILFDFDGTLIDTNDLIILALQKTALKFLSRELTRLLQLKKCKKPIVVETVGFS